MQTVNETQSQIAATASTMNAVQRLYDDAMYSMIPRKSEDVYDKHSKREVEEIWKLGLHCNGRGILQEFLAPSVGDDAGHIHVDPGQKEEVEGHELCALFM